MINKKKVIWNTKKEGGWETYKTLTSDNKQFERKVEKQNHDSDKMMRVIAKEIEKTKLQVI